MDDGVLRTEFYKSVVVNKGSSENIVSAIDNCLCEDEIPWTNVLQVMSDSPNVMRGHKNGVIVRIKKNFAPNILDIGGCSLHHIANAVSYATASLGDDIENVAVDIHSFFKHRSGLCEEFRNMQVLLDLPEHRILRFVSTRWLSVLPVVKRLLEQLVGLRTFFKDLKISKPQLAKQPRALRIMDALNDPVIEAKMKFLSAVLPQFESLKNYFKAKMSKCQCFIPKWWS